MVTRNRFCQRVVIAALGTSIIVLFVTIIELIR